MMDRPGWKECAVPYMVHTDAVPCVTIGKAGGKSFDVLSWQGVFGKGTTLYVKLLIYGIFES
jgi:hypothetical protein